MHVVSLILLAVEQCMQLFAQLLEKAFLRKASHELAELSGCTLLQACRGGQKDRCAF